MFEVSITLHFRSSHCVWKDACESLSRLNLETKVFLFAKKNCEFSLSVCCNTITDYGYLDLGFKMALVFDSTFSLSATLSVMKTFCFRMQMMNSASEFETLRLLITEVNGCFHVPCGQVEICICL